MSTAGIERLICESCGYVSVRYQFGLIGAVDRKKFARPADSRAVQPEDVLIAV